MKAIEVIYRYEAGGSHARSQPSNSEAAWQRLEDGNRDFAALFDGLMDDDGLAQQVVQVDARDLGLLPRVKGRRDSAPSRQSWAAPTRGCRSNSSSMRDQTICS